MRVGVWAEVRMCGGLRGWRGGRAAHALQLCRVVALVDGTTNVEVSPESSSRRADESLHDGHHPGKSTSTAKKSDEHLMGGMHC